MVDDHNSVDSAQTDGALAERLRVARSRIFAEVGKVIVGQREVVDEMLIALLAGGHCLITGAPGLAKTLLVKTVAEVFDLSFQRIQFTPDLMPSDITGSEMLEDGPSGKQLVFKKGPVFANMILADEINRTPPKTQAALLEAMQEHQVTAAGRSLRLPEPFFVLATQNPIEMEGTYPLPEAQLDRFMFSIKVEYPSFEEEIDVVTRTTGRAQEPLEHVLTRNELLHLQKVALAVVAAPDIVRYAVEVARRTRPGGPDVPELVKQYVAWGAGPRASQYLILGAKARAALHGRPHASREDVRALAKAVLGHRVLLNFQAEADRVDADAVIDAIIASLPAAKM
ncbi:MAG: MoxR family ATPase [Myxococcales bacterium]|nr:MoxR family ATPase [Myxococcales bacterium]